MVETKSTKVTYVVGRTSEMYFWMATYLLCLVDFFFQETVRTNVYIYVFVHYIIINPLLWEPTVALFSPNCPFIRMRWT